MRIPRQKMQFFSFHTRRTKNNKIDVPPGGTGSHPSKHGKSSKPTFEPRPNNETLAGGPGQPAEPLPVALLRHHPIAQRIPGQHSGSRRGRRRRAAELVVTTGAFKLGLPAHRLFAAGRSSSIASAPIGGRRRRGRHGRNPSKGSPCKGEDDAVDGTIGSSEGPEIKKVRENGSPY